jgi:hypothetical protein
VNAALGQRLPDSLFVEVRRDPVDVAYSIYRARRAEVGDPRSWWSTRVHGWRGLVGRPPVEQIVEQIAIIGEAHEAARELMGVTRWMTIRYADICAAPQASIERVFQHFELDPPVCTEELPDTLHPSVAVRSGIPDMVSVEKLLARRGVRSD